MGRLRRQGSLRLRVGLGTVALTGAILVAAQLPPVAPDLLEVEMSPEGDLLGLDPLEVIVRFPSGGAVAPETFRAILNEEDVTAEFTAGENGAFARLRVVPDGANVLRLGVFGRSSWSEALLVEDEREVRFRVRRPAPPQRG